MGATTDDLIDLAYQVSSHPPRRELDMLLSTGERISMALMSMALQDLNCPAISFTGSQAGVLTCGSHSNARIKNIAPIRVEKELVNQVVVLAGFQGVDPITKEITTLGRGGTDTTAVAMAAYFKDSQCQILKDVPGIMSGDPDLVEHPSCYSHLNFEILLDMTYWGASVLHFRSVALARQMKVPLFIGPSHIPGHGTTINGDKLMFEETEVLAINAHEDVQRVKIPTDSFADALTLFESSLKKEKLPWPQILAGSPEGSHFCLYYTAPSEILSAIANALTQDPQIRVDQKQLASVTLTCHAHVGTSMLKDVSDLMAKNRIPILFLLQGPLSITALIKKEQQDATITLLHKHFIEKS